MSQDTLDDLAQSLEALLDAAPVATETLPEPPVAESPPAEPVQKLPEPAPPAEKPKDFLADVVFPDSIFHSSLEAVIRPSPSTGPAQLQQTLAQFSNLDPKEIEALRQTQAAKARAAAAVVYSAAVNRLGDIVADPEVTLSLPATLDVLKTLAGPAGAEPKEQAKAAPMAQIIFNIDRPSQTNKEVITVEMPTDG